MNKYAVTSNEELRLLCIKNDYFTEGSNEQYSKLFDLNSEGATLEEMALVIWICSDAEVNTRESILETLQEAHKEYEQRFADIDRE